MSDQFASNPAVVRSGDSFIIKFVRRSGKVLHWVQDITARKMKNTAIVDRPLVRFSSIEEADAELENVVVPYLKARGDDEIYGF